MIFEPSVEELTKKVGNNYEVANLLAKRAREIMENTTEEETTGKKALQIAAEEIATGKVIIENKEEE